MSALGSARLQKDAFPSFATIWGGEDSSCEIGGTGEKNQLTAFIRVLYPRVRIPCTLTDALTSLDRQCLRRARLILGESACARAVRVAAEGFPALKRWLSDTASASVSLVDVHAAVAATGLRAVASTFHVAAHGAVGSGTSAVLDRVVADLRRGWLARLGGVDVYR